MQHLALIMDGNRRWAQQRALNPWRGHEAGVNSVKCVIKFCLDHTIKYLSLYAFSLENFKRSPDEVAYLFELLVNNAYAQLEHFQKESIGLKFIGDKKLFPSHIAPIITTLEQQTAGNTRLIIHVLFCYGAQQEIAQAAKIIAYKVKEGLLSPDHITPAVVTDSLWCGPIPEPELIIRTGGRKRLSNFLLFQAAYSELCFLDCLWPDLTYEDLKKSYEDFEYTQRNFGS